MADPREFMTSCSFDNLHPGSQGLGAQVIRENSEFGSGWQGAILDKVVSSDTSTFAYNKIKEYQHGEREGARKTIAGVMQRKATNMYGGGVYGRGKYPGMPDRGMAASSREQHSDFKKDFASRFDALRGLTKAGETFEDMLSSKGFKEAIEQGQVVKELGQGRLGKAKLYKGKFRGSEFEYVGKEALPAGEVGEGFEEMAERAIEHEYRALSEIKGDILPTAYGFSKEKNMFFMEKMPGKTVAQLREEGSEVSSEIFDIVEKQSVDVAKKNYWNPDVNPGNIMFEPETGQVSWIDFGAVIPGAQEELAKKRMAMVIKGAGTQMATTNNPIKKINAIHPGADAGLGVNAIKKHSDFGSGWRGNALEEMARQAVKVDVPPTVLTKQPTVRMPKNAPQGKDPADVTRIVKRNKKFRQSSKDSVGIGLRSANKAGKGHCSFGSTRSV